MSTISAVRNVSRFLFPEFEAEHMESNVIDLTGDEDYNNIEVINLVSDDESESVSDFSEVSTVLDPTMGGAISDDLLENMEEDEVFEEEYANHLYGIPIDENGQPEGFEEDYPVAYPNQEGPMNRMELIRQFEDDVTILAMNSGMSEEEFIQLMYPVMSITRHQCYQCLSTPHFMTGITDNEMDLNNFHYCAGCHKVCNCPWRYP